MNGDREETEIKRKMVQPWWGEAALEERRGGQQEEGGSETKQRRVTPPSNRICVLTPVLHNVNMLVLIVLPLSGALNGALPFRTAIGQNLE